MSDSPSPLDSPPLLSGPSPPPPLFLSTSYWPRVKWGSPAWGEQWNTPSLRPEPSSLSSLPFLVSHTAREATDFIKLTCLPLLSRQSRHKFNCFSPFSQARPSILRGTLATCARQSSPPSRWRSTSADSIRATRSSTGGRSSYWPQSTLEFLVYLVLNTNDFFPQGNYQGVDGPPKPGPVSAVQHKAAADPGSFNPASPHPLFPHNPRLRVTSHRRRPHRHPELSQREPEASGEELPPASPARPGSARRDGRRGPAAAPTAPACGGGDGGGRAPAAPAAAAAAPAHGHEAASADRHQAAAHHAAASHAAGHQEMTTILFTYKNVRLPKLLLTRF